MPATAVWDAHRHLGALPSYRFYGGPPVVPSSAQVGSVDELIAALDEEGTERAVVLPN